MDGNAHAVRQLLDETDRSQVNAVLGCLETRAQPLHIAAIWGDAEIARILLEHDASPTALSIDGCTALHYAVNYGHSAVVDEILRRDVNDQPMYPMGESINLSTDFNKAPPLVFATSKGFTRIVQKLPKAGANPNVCGINGLNGLHAAGGGRFDEIVAALLQAGADPNNVNPEGIIPIHVVNSACSAQKLIEAGSNLSATIHSNNPYNFTVGAIPLRISEDYANLAVVEVIARYSTREEIHMRAANGRSALSAAYDSYKPSIVQVLSSILELLVKNKVEKVADIEE